MGIRHEELRSRALRRGRMDSAVIRKILLDS